MKCRLIVFMFLIVCFMVNCGGHGEGNSKEAEKAKIKKFKPAIDLREKATPPQRVPGGYNFSVHSPDAKYISLVGDFNNWIDNRHPMSKNKYDVWSVTVPLRKGKYSYKFNLDGIWIIDKNSPEIVKDKMGDQRSLLEVPEDIEFYEEPYFYGATNASAPLIDRKGILFSYKEPNARLVTVAGTFNNWEKDQFILRKNKNGVWSGYIQIPKGEYYYKYCIDNIWSSDPCNPLKEDDGQGDYKSKLIIEQDIEDRASAPFPIDYEIVRFSFYNKDLPSKYQISVVGNFNNWRTNINIMSDRDFDKEWFTTVRFKPGEYYYKFYLAGREFFDPANKIKKIDPEGKETGYLNIVLSFEKRNIKFTYKNTSARNVYLVGDFNDWNPEADRFLKDQYGLWYIVKKLPPGKYVYQYSVNGKWGVDPSNPRIVYDMNGAVNSICEVK